MFNKVFRTFISSVICLAKITTCNFSSVLMSNYQLNKKSLGCNFSDNSTFFLKREKKCTLSLKERGRSATLFFDKERHGTLTK